MKKEKLYLGQSKDDNPVLLIKHELKDGIWTFGHLIFKEDGTHIHYIKDWLDCQFTDCVFSHTWMDDVQWSILRDAYKAAYLLEKVQKLYHHGDQFVPEVKDCLSDPEMTNFVNDDISRVLDMAWDNLQEWFEEKDNSPAWVIQ